jgi:hypothetical protein
MFVTMAPNLTEPTERLVIPWHVSQRVGGKDGA